MGKAGEGKTEESDSKEEREREKQMTKTGKVQGRESTKTNKNVIPNMVPAVFNIVLMRK